MPSRLVQALLFFLLLAVLVGCQKKEAETTDTVIGPGAKAPAFTLKDTSGQSVSLQQLRGKVIFLNFWATWCPPCRAEMPSMERLNEVFANKDFVMLAVNIEETGMTVVGPFMQQNPYHFSVLLDNEGVVQNLYGVYRFPETFIIDKKGKIVDHIVGGRDWSSAEMLKYIADLIDK